jgi:hypothetical protein
LAAVLALLFLSLSPSACGGGREKPAEDAPLARAQPEMFLSRTSHFPPASFQAFATPPQDLRQARAAELHFSLNGRPFPLPLVHGTVAGIPTWMLVDTGANSHVITGWLARRAGFKLKNLGEVGSDHAGRPVTTFSVDKPKVTIDGFGALHNGPMLVTDVPEAIERLGIGMFISPQWLGDEDEAVVLDLAGKLLMTSPFEDAARAIKNRGKDLAPIGGSLCEDTGSSIRGLGFVIPATVEGHKVRLLVDTGAHHTDLLSTTPPAKLLLSRSVANSEQMYAASGLVRTRLLKHAKVSVGDFTVTSDVDLVPGVSDPVCPRDGVVSMDVLQSCVLVLGQKQMMGRCE